MSLTNQSCSSAVFLNTEHTTFHGSGFLSFQHSCQCSFSSSRNQKKCHIILNSWKLKESASNIGKPSVKSRHLRSSVYKCINSGKSIVSSHWCRTSPSSRAALPSCKIGIFAYLKKESTDLSSGTSAWHFWAELREWPMLHTWNHEKANKLGRFRPGGFGAILEREKLTFCFESLEQCVKLSVTVTCTQFDARLVLLIFIADPFWLLFWEAKVESNN